MNIKEQVAKELASMDNWPFNDLKEHSTSFNEGAPTQAQYLRRADSVIPLVLRAISKESSKLDGTAYRVPDYSKFRALWEEFVSGKEGGIDEGR